MAITEVFGGQYNYIKGIVLCTKCCVLFRVPNRQNSVVPHSMWLAILVCNFQFGYYYDIVVTTQLPGSNGYCGGKVVFIDTEVLFRLICLSSHFEILPLFTQTGKQRIPCILHLLDPTEPILANYIYFIPIFFHLLVFITFVLDCWI